MARRSFHVACLLDGRFRDGELSVSATGMDWQPTKGRGRAVTVNAPDVASVVWSRGSILYELRVHLTPGGSVRFQGLKQDDFERISSAVKEFFGVTVETQSLSVRGTNWGELKFQGQELTCVMEDGTGPSFPLSSVSQSLVQGRNEVSLEFHKRTPEETKEHHQLSEVRFFVPPEAAIEGVDPKGSESAPESLHRTILEHTDLARTGDVLCTIKKLKALVPRAQFTLDLFQSFLRLRGVTHTHRVEYTNISRMMFLFPEQQAHGTGFFVISLSSPVRQGQSSYPMIVIEFDKEEEIPSEEPILINMSTEEIEERYPESRLASSLTGRLWEAFVSVMRAFTKKKVVGVGSFRTMGKHPRNAVDCTYKNMRGLLFPLERSLVFLPKPAMIIPYNDIATVEVARAGGSGQGSTFELKISHGLRQPTVFDSIVKKECEEPLLNLLRAKKLNVTADRETESNPVIEEASGESDESESDDDDYQASDSDSGSDASVVEEDNPAAPDEDEPPAKRRRTTRARKK